MLIRRRWIQHRRIFRQLPSGSFQAVRFLWPVAKNAMILAQWKRIEPRSYRVMIDDLEKVRALSADLSKALRLFPKDTWQWIIGRSILLDNAREDCLLDALPVMSWSRIVPALKTNRDCSESSIENLMSEISNPTMPGRLESLADAFGVLKKQAEKEKSERVGAPVVNDHARKVDLEIFNGLAGVLRSAGLGLEHLREIATVIYSWAAFGENPTTSWASREEAEAKRRHPLIRHTPG